MSWSDVMWASKLLCPQQSAQSQNTNASATHSLTHSTSHAMPQHVPTTILNNHKPQTNKKANNPHSPQCQRPFLVPALPWSQGLLAALGYN